jgi:hypothetical protein
VNASLTKKAPYKPYAGNLELCVNLGDDV